MAHFSMIIMPISGSDPGEIQHRKTTEDSRKFELAKARQDKIFDRRLELYRGVISKVYEALRSFRSADFLFDLLGPEDEDGKRLVRSAIEAIQSATKLLTEGRLFASDTFVVAFETLIAAQKKGYERYDIVAETLVSVKVLPDLIKELERVAIKEIAPEVA